MCVSVMRSPKGWLASGAGAILLLALGLLIAHIADRAMGINDLWQRQIEHRNLDGKVVKVRGLAIFEPQSDFKYNTLYLVDSDTEEAYRQPDYAFWFGIRIDDLSCSADDDTWTCEPFDPSQAQALELTGTLHITPVGKKDVMSLSGIDLAQSRQMINGKWLPIHTGKFIIPLRRDG
jgi:hypothetical protein